VTINLIIFRVPDIDGDISLVELDYTDGVLSEEGQIFSVEAGDFYAELPLNKIVLAERIHGGSRSFAVFDVGAPEDPDVPNPVHEIPFEDLEQIVPFLIGEYEKMFSTDDLVEGLPQVDTSKLF